MPCLPALRPQLCPAAGQSPAPDSQYLPSSWRWSPLQAQLPEVPGAQGVGKEKGWKIPRGTAGPSHSAFPGAPRDIPCLGEGDGTCPCVEGTC